jgi:hypothetical protein
MGQARTRIGKTRQIDFIHVMDLLCASARAGGREGARALHLCVVWLADCVAFARDDGKPIHPTTMAAHMIYGSP